MNYALAAAALEEFNIVNFCYRYFVKAISAAIVKRLDSVPKLFHSYVLKRKKGCPSVAPLGTIDQSQYGHLYMN